MNLVLSLMICQAILAPDLPQLLRDDACFALRKADEAGQIPKGALGDVYRGYLAARFDRPQEASTLLKNFLSDPAPKPKEQVADAYELLIDTDARLGHFKESRQEAEEGLRKLADFLNDRRKQEFSDAVRRASILADVQPQTAEIVPFEIKVTKDLASLNRIPVSVGTSKVNAVLDTGAQLCVLTKSAAQQAGVRPLEGSVPVDAVTGSKVASQLAVIETLSIGSSTFHHVLALVMDDSALAIGNYKISAIIGFPVLEALGRLDFGRDGILRAGNISGAPSFNNLALNGLGPIVEGNYHGVDLTFTIDTGAVNSHFTKNLVDRFPEIASGEAGHLNLGGAGGLRSFATYRIPEFQITVGGQPVKLSKVDVLAEASNADIDRHYGNLGQDIFRQFDHMVIDFKRMSFELTGKR